MNNCSKILHYLCPRFIFGIIFKVMEEIRAAEVEAPVRIGDVILTDVCGTDIIATKNIE